MNKIQQVASIPIQKVGPIELIGPVVKASVYVPLATFETPLWPSANRGAKVTRLAGGICAVVLKDCMARSVILEACHVSYANEVFFDLQKRRSELEAVVTKTSRFAKLTEWQVQMVGKLLYLRFTCETGDAAGHNMVTQAADALLQWLLNRYERLKYISISGNYCVDKKVSAVNGILGRGKYVIAETVIPRELCEKHLRTTPEKIVELNIKKNLIGSTLAGGVRTANAHFANILLAVYLATGQDAANIVEGSQGIVHTELQGDDLYFSVTLPNIIVGSIGNGKHVEFAKENLKEMGCLENCALGENAKRLAVITAATVLCGELSLLAAQTNPGELMKSHLRFERMAVKQTKEGSYV